MEDRIHALTAQITEYAQTRQLESVQKALPILNLLMFSRARNESAHRRMRNDMLHCLEVCTILIDLRLPLTREEEDDLLSAVLLHIYPENMAVDDLQNSLVTKLGFSNRVYEIIDTFVPCRDMLDEEQAEFYTRLQENKLALLAALADRGNIIQKLYQFSTWNAHRYIDETKACYYPMCIYAKENYHELLGIVRVLMEKLRTLIEVSEVFLRRYETRESELIQDILALREENATIKGIIRKFQHS